MQENNDMTIDLHFGGIVKLPGQYTLAFQQELLL